MTESEVMDVVADAAEVGGWWRAHFRPGRSMKGRGWQTPGTYEAGSGWPDLVLVRDVVLAWELKADGRPSSVAPEQQAWLERFAAAGVETAVVHPANLDDYAIPRLLARPVWGRVPTATTTR